MSYNYMQTLQATLLDIQHKTVHIPIRQLPIVAECFSLHFLHTPDQSVFNMVKSEEKTPNMLWFIITFFLFAIQSCEFINF